MSIDDRYEPTYNKEDLDRLTAEALEDTGLGPQARALVLDSLATMQETMAILDGDGPDLETPFAQADEIGEQD